MEGIPIGGRSPQLTHIRAISGRSVNSVRDDSLLGKPASEDDLSAVLFHGTMLANFEQIVEHGLIPGG